MTAEQRRVAAVLDRSARLTVALGDAGIGGSSLRDLLRIGGVSLWDSTEALFALNRLPQHIRGDMPVLSRLKEAARAYYFGPPRDYRWQPFAIDSSRTVPSPSDTRVLGLSFAPRNYAKIFQPVVPRLSQNGITPWILSAHAQPASAIAPQWTMMRDFYTAAVDTRWRELLEEYRDRDNRIRRHGGLRELITSVDPSLWPAARPAFEHLLRQDWPAALQQVALAETVLRSHRPSLVVVAEDAAPNARIYILLARALDIPSVQVQGGYVDALSIEWRFAITSKTLVFGPRSARVVCDHGVRPERVIVSGCPEWDELLHPDPAEVAATRQALHVSPGMRLALFASSPPVQGTAYGFNVFDSPQKRRTLLRDLCTAAQQAGDVRLAIKPHPEESQQELESMVEGFSNVVVVDRRHPINHLIDACDLFITQHSTTGIQALLAGKHLVIVQYPGSFASDDWHDSGAAIVRSSDELAFELRGGLPPATVLQRADLTRTFLRDVAELNGGRTADRVAKIIRGFVAAPAPVMQCGTY